MRPESTAPSAQRLFAPLKLVAVVATLAEDGVAAKRVLRGTGLAPAELIDSATRVSVQQILQVYGNARELSSDPALAFRVGARLHVSSYGLWGLALLCMPTLRQVIDFAMRYFRLTGPVIPALWRVEATNLAWALAPAAVLHESGIPLPLHRFLRELQATIQVTLHKDIMGPDCLPSRMLVSDTPAHASIYARHLGCPVEFGAGIDELHYPAFWLERAPQLANPITAAALLESCTTLLGELQRASGVAAQVVRALVEKPGRFPDIEAVAATLHTTSRTLRRRLDAEGTSYQQLLTDVRRSLAIDYLRHTSMSSEDIAEALGFSDAASFRHAFRRWTQKSPSEYRPAARVPPP